MLAKSKHWPSCFSGADNSGVEQKHLSNGKKFGGRMKERKKRGREEKFMNSQELITL